MTASEFNAARAVLGQTDDELAGTFLVRTDTIRAWSEGRARIPRRSTQHITWLAATAERETALRSAGLPECEWLKAHDEKSVPDNTDEALKYVESINEHAASCALCLSRERYLAERFGPMPPMPQPAWMRVFAWAEHLPPWTRPAVFGAVLLGGLVLLRMLFVLPSLLSRPRGLVQVIVTILAAAGAGASGGLAYSLTRPSLKRLGRRGDYLTGIICVLAYMSSLALVAPLAFGESLIRDRAGVVILLLVSILFGLFVGHSWFRSE